MLVICDVLWCRCLFFHAFCVFFSSTTQWSVEPFSSSMQSTSNLVCSMCKCALVLTYVMNFKCVFSLLSLYVCVFVHVHIRNLIIQCETKICTVRIAHWEYHASLLLANVHNRTHANASLHWGRTPFFVLLLRSCFKSFNSTVDQKVIHLTR